MSFWNTSDGSNAAQNAEAVYVAPSGSDPLPDDAQVVFAIEDVSVKTFDDGGKSIGFMCRANAPQEYANRVFFVNLKPWDHDTSKRDKALRMLAAIDKNCGGRLAASGQEPTTESLQQALLNRPMIGKLGMYDFEGDQGKRITGNYFKGVAPVNRSAQAAPAKAQPKPKPQQNNDNFADMDDSIPF